MCWCLIIGSCCFALAWVNLGLIFLQLDFLLFLGTPCAVVLLQPWQLSSDSWSSALFCHHWDSLLHYKTSSGVVTVFHTSASDLSWQRGMRWLYSSNEYPVTVFFSELSPGCFASIHHAVRIGPFASVHLVYCFLPENKLYIMRSLKGFQ